MHVPHLHARQRCQPLRRSDADQNAAMPPLKAVPKSQSMPQLAVTSVQGWGLLSHGSVCDARCEAPREPSGALFPPQLLHRCDERGPMPTDPPLRHLRPPLIPLQETTHAIPLPVLPPAVSLTLVVCNTQQTTRSPARAWPLAAVKTCQGVVRPPCKLRALMSDVWTAQHARWRASSLAGRSPQCPRGCPAWLMCSSGHTLD